MTVEFDVVDVVMTLLSLTVEYDDVVAVVVIIIPVFCRLVH